MKRVGDHVCKECGRVATREARFCQCSASLVKKCSSCRSEFFVDDAICPKCGWRQNVAISTVEGQDQLATRIYASFSKGDLDGAETDLEALCRAGKEAGLFAAKSLKLIETLLLSSFDASLCKMHHRVDVSGERSKFHDELCLLLSTTGELLVSAIESFFQRVRSHQGPMYKKVIDRSIGDNVPLLGGVFANSQMMKEPEQWRCFIGACSIN